MVMKQSLQEQLLTDRNYAKVLNGGGDAHSIIRVKKLSAQALVGGSIWGVTSDDGHRNVFQPVLISSVLSLREPFRSAAQSDSVNGTTVNYSTLSKEILKAVANCRPDIPFAERSKPSGRDLSLFDLVEWILVWLTGFLPTGERLAPDPDRKKRSAVYPIPLLDIEKLYEFGVTLLLPKATLLSGGVSLSVSSMYFPSKRYRSALEIHGIRVPTLIGVNQKERLARQLVIVNVNVDPYICKDRDYYNELEQLIVKTTEESSFETLESLATHLSDRIIKYFIYAYLSKPVSSIPTENYPDVFSNVRICLEKPSAVTLADAPSIETLRSSDPREDKDAERLWGEFTDLAKKDNLQAIQIPYPLQGTLEAWISNNLSRDST